MNNELSKDNQKLNRVKQERKYWKRKYKQGLKLQRYTDNFVQTLVSLIASGDIVPKKETQW